MLYDVLRHVAATVVRLPLLYLPTTVEAVVVPGRTGNLVAFIASFVTFDRIRF